MKAETEVETDTWNEAAGVLKTETESATTTEGAETMIVADLMIAHETETATGTLVASGLATMTNTEIAILMMVASTDRGEIDPLLKNAMKDNQKPLKSPMHKKRHPRGGHLCHKYS